MSKRQYPCPHPDCENKYASKNNVRRHLKFAHPNYHQFQCEQCGKVLSSRQNFNQHLHIHTGARPFICHLCGVCFRQGSQLSIHKRIHLPQNQCPMSIPLVCPKQLTEMMEACGFKETSEDEKLSYKEEILPPIGDKGLRESGPVTLRKILY